MHKISRYRKFIVLTLSVLIFSLVFSLSPARAELITTQYVIQTDTDRARILALLGRAEVTAQLQAYGISHKEAVSRVEGLTDSEIALIADKMDNLPDAAGSNYEQNGSLLALVGLALYAIFAAIAIYFSRTMDTEEKTDE